MSTHVRSSMYIFLIHMHSSGLFVKIKGEACWGFTLKVGVSGFGIKVAAINVQYKYHVPNHL